MFTRKLAKKGLIGNGLLFITAVISLAATNQIGGTLSQSGVSDSTSQQLSFDTFFLKLNGASEIDMQDAPVISLNKNATVYVKDYVKKHSELLEKIKKKSPTYFKITDAVFKKYGLPQELKYLAVVESELKTTALSRVGARGAWQLMTGTARELSLKVTAKNDERTHFYKSTVAAAKYLRDLHKQLGDWLLVIAAYNSGPGKVYSAIKKSGSRNFWKLQNYLPAETRGHVKRFISTHYYFEGKGSVTTLTRQEVISYRKAMQEYVAKQNLRKEKQTENDEDTLNTASIGNEATIARSVTISESKLDD